MTMVREDEETLTIIERKILRTILGSVKIAENGYRVRDQEIGKEL